MYFFISESGISRKINCGMSVIFSYTISAYGDHAFIRHLFFFVHLRVARVYIILIHNTTDNQPYIYNPAANNDIEHNIYTAFLFFSCIF
jgi:hypothetical protein